MIDSSHSSILVVDDSLPSLKMLTDMLETQGYAVRPADSGELALVSARNDPPQLIVLDIRMPGMDGFEVFRQLQQDEATKGIPVIFIVAVDDAVQRIEGLRLGAVDFIIRPFDREQTLARITTHFEAARLRSLVADQAADIQAINERLATENTALKATRDALRQSEQWLTDSQRVAGLGHYAFDIEGDSWNASPALCTVFGVDEGYASDFAGWLGIIHPADREGMLSYFTDEVVGKRRPFDREYRIIRSSDGAVRWVHGQGTVDYSADGTAIAMFGIIQDITEARRIQADLALSEEKFSTAFKTSPDAISITRLSDDLYLDVNDGYTHVFGYKREDIEGRNAAQIPLWVDPAQRERLVASLIAEGSISNFEALFRRKDGSVIDGLISAQVIDVAGEPCMLAVTRDISERKAAEAAVSEQSEMVRLLLDSTVEAIYGLDKDGDFTFCNAASLKMFGYPTEDALLGKSSHELTHHTRLDGTTYAEEECPIHRGLERGESAHAGDEVFWRADGTSFPVEYWSHPMLDDGEVVGSVVTFTDITERRKLEEALQRRLVALTQPAADVEGLAFADLFDIDEIQSIQDAFSAATGVGSVITRPDGTPITRPSNFCRLCEKVIRRTEKGLANCIESDARLWAQSPPDTVALPCLSGGLWDTGARIAAGGHHVANWMIGQVRDEEVSDEEMLRYADEIGADKDEYRAALAEVTTMSRERFELVSAALFAFASELSVVAFQNVQQARFITEQQRFEGEILGLNVDLGRRVEERAQLLERLSGMLDSVVDVVSSVSEMSDPYTAGHQRRVAELSCALAEELGMSDEEIDEIRVAGLMHDVGKVSVPAEILSRPGRLSATEFRLVQDHSEAGYTIMKSTHMSDVIADLVHQHHERCDGSGYPLGLVADELLDGSKVLMVADVVEAMMSHRPYREALGEEAALAEIAQGAGGRYDARVAESCARLFGEKGFAFSERHAAEHDR